MKILQLIPSLGSGGAERFVVDLSNALSELGHEVILVSLFSEVQPHDFLKSELSKKILYISLNKGIGFSIKSVFDFFCLIKKSKPDVIHTHIGSIKYSFFTNVLFFKKIKFFHTLHSDAEYEKEGKLGYILRKILFGTKLCFPITISTESSLSFSKLYGLKSVTIFNGRKFVSNDFFNDRKNPYESQVSDNEIILVNLARVVDVKNQAMLIESVTSLIERGFKVRLYIVGRIEDQNIYIKLQQGLNEKITFVGEVANPLDYLFFSHISVLSSIFEGLPISVLEAMSLGKIFVSTPVGGVPSVVQNNFNGFLSKSFDSEDFLDVLRIVIDKFKHNDCDSISLNAIKTSKLYDINDSVMKYMQVYQTLSVK